MIRHVVPRPLSVLALALMLSIVVAPVASAQDGVQVDPDSPPAVEYALPLQEARGDAARPGAGGAGGGAGAADGSGAAPAFGSGITRKPARADATAGERPARPGSGSDARPASERPRPPAGAGARRTGDVGGPAMLYALGSAVAILLAGGLLGLALRRRQSPA